LDGSIAFVAAAADRFAWAHCFSERCCRFLRMGRVHFYQQLAMASLWPITFLRGSADSLGWANEPELRLSFSIGAGFAYIDTGDKFSIRSFYWLIRII
jgi:hypothetical protein